MAIPLEEYDEIIGQLPSVLRGVTPRGDQIELTEEDERILDKVWSDLAEEEGLPRFDIDRDYSKKADEDKKTLNDRPPK